MNRGMMVLLLCLLAGMSCSRTTPVGEIQAAPQNKDKKTEEKPRHPQSPVVSPPEFLAFTGGHQSAPSSISFASGSVSLHTSAFRPVAFDETSNGWRQRTPDRDHAPSMVVATVEIRNESREAVELRTLEIIELGQVTVYEDHLARGGLLLGLAEPDFGMVSCCVDESHSGRSRPGTNLIPGQAYSMAPHTTRAFRIYLACSRLLLDDRFVLPQHGGCTDQGLDLDAIDRRTPWPESATHVLVARADIAIRNSRYCLYSQEIYGLSPALLIRKLKRSSEAPTNDGAPDRNHFLGDYYALPPPEFIARIVPYSVKTFHETLAYRVAADMKVVPAGFDSLAVSPFCYSCDPDSPLRPSPLSREVASYRGGPRQRSNIVDVLRRVREEHPVLWPGLDKGVRTIAESKGEDSLARKARYVAQELASPRPRIATLGQPAATAIQDDKPVVGRVRDYGRYRSGHCAALSPVKTPVRLGVPGEGNTATILEETSSTTVFSTVDDEHIQTTTIIPCRVGETFGFRFSLANLPTGPVKYRSEMLHPPLRQPDGTMLEKTVVRMTIPAGGKVPDAEMWSFLAGYEYELVPGTWTRKVYVNDKEVVSMSFEVVDPSQLADTPSPKTAPSGHVLLGIQYTNNAEDGAVANGRKAGALVQAVLLGTPADRAGLQTGDVIVEFEETAVYSRDDLRRLIRQNAGKTVHLVIVREERRLNLNVRLADP